MIDKIIHQIAPNDQSRWHPLWKECRYSWTSVFDDFQFNKWNDDSDIDKLIASIFPQFIDLYRKIPLHIIKIDFAKLCILYNYGGIYADMDMYCFKNFYNHLNEKICLLESPIIGEKVQNSLICAESKNSFILECINESYNRIKNNQYLFDKLTIHDTEIIKNVAGPGLLSDIFLGSNYHMHIQLLNKELFHPDIEYFSENLYTKHMLTGQWGRETYQALQECKEINYNYLSFEEFYKLDYENFRLKLSKYSNYDFKINFYSNN